MMALLLALALDRGDAIRIGRAADACDLVVLREELHRVRVEVAEATRPEEQAAKWEQFDRIAAAIKRCGLRT